MVQFLREGYSLVIKDLSYIVFFDTTEKNLLFKLPIAKNNMFLLYLDGEKTCFQNIIRRQKLVMTLQVQALKFHKLELFIQ